MADSVVAEKAKLEVRNALDRLRAHSIWWRSPNARGGSTYHVPDDPYFRHLPPFAARFARRSLKAPGVPFSPPATPYVSSPSCCSPPSPRPSTLP
jgi:hypothetical protein